MRPTAVERDSNNRPTIAFYEETPEEEQESTEALVAQAERGAEVAEALAEAVSSSRSHAAASAGSHH
jgi:hypothetical protein